VWSCHNNVLRAHASAVREFRRIVPNGKIGMNLAIQWSEPRSDSAEDRVRRRPALSAAGPPGRARRPHAASELPAHAGRRPRRSATWVRTRSLKRAEHGSLAVRLHVV